MTRFNIHARTTVWAILWVLLCLNPGLRATQPGGSSFDGTDNAAFAGNLGFISLQADATNGVAVGANFVEGFAYSGNVGWIFFGDGSPSNGIHYSNTNGSDTGVNVVNYTSNPSGGEADLRGFAFGANIGWIQFEATGDPRLELKTGTLRGFAYGANVGWINLGEMGLTLTTRFIKPEPDSDGDGMGDGYEIQNFGSLRVSNGTGDFDGDGRCDGSEYIADTDPTDPVSRLEVIAFAPASPADGSFDLTFTSQPTRFYQIVGRTELNDPSGIDIGAVICAEGLTTLQNLPERKEKNFFYTVVAKLPLAPPSH